MVAQQVNESRVLATDLMYVSTELENGITDLTKVLLITQILIKEL
jgi:hypothetical protein